MFTFMCHARMTDPIWTRSRGQRLTAASVCSRVQEVQPSFLSEDLKERAKAVLASMDVAVRSVMRA